tara:strand:- start:84 stop:605 length:522 start_codon:yes stop_codon:yes gene_type:complete
MHLNKYYFINKFEPDHIKKLNKDISIIYRNYSLPNNVDLIIKIRNFCNKNKRKFYISNNVKLAIKLNLDGVYIPSFNKDLNHLNYQIKNKFKIIGSAHNLKEIRIKENQGVSEIFISSIFKSNKNYLGYYKFKNLSSFTKRKVVALGGIKTSNIKRVYCLDVSGIAAISLYDK